MWYLTTFFHELQIKCFLFLATVFLGICQGWWISLKVNRLVKKLPRCWGTLLYSSHGSGEQKKDCISRSVMYRVVGYITARSCFKTSWVPARKVSEQYLQPYGLENAFSLRWQQNLWHIYYCIVRTCWEIMFTISVEFQ